MCFYRGLNALQYLLVYHNIPRILNYLMLLWYRIICPYTTAVLAFILRLIVFNQLDLTLCEVTALTKECVRYTII